MNLIRLSTWDPFRDILGFQDRFNRPLGDTQGHLSSIEGFGAWIPPVDVIEKDDRLIFRAEIPGVNRDDIDVNVENGTLVLRGEKKQETQVDNESAHRVERSYGSFSRSFALPTSVAADRITANYRDGVLEVVLPKAEEAKPRKIKILGA